MTELNLWLGCGNLLCAIVFGALTVPLIRGRVKRNESYGVRFSGSGSSAWPPLIWGSGSGKPTAPRSANEPQRRRLGFVKEFVIK